MPLSTFVAFLNWRTFNGAKTAKDTAVAGIRFKYLVTVLAIIKKLACIRRHGFYFFVTTFRTSNSGSEYYADV